MDWYSWLSKTNLEPTFVYEYGLTFARNELQDEDLAYFNHDFLQSIGISIAKHRLEILKLARKEVKGKLNGFSRLVMAMNKTKKLFTKNIGKLGLHNKNSSQLKDNVLNGPHWNGRQQKVINGEKAMVATRSSTIMRSGPLDRRMQDKLMVTNRSVSVSGPLDGKLLTYPNWSPMVTKPKEKMGLSCKSPNISGPIDRWALSPNMNYYSGEKLGDDGGVQSLWALMFQDMKPT